MMLKEVIMMDTIKEGIHSNLIKNDKIFLKVMESMVANIEDNRLSVTISEDGLEGLIEVDLYKGEETGQYLLEARLFDKEDMMVNAYLEIINKDLSIYEEYVDDVWSYDNWEIA